VKNTLLHVFDEACWVLIAIRQCFSNNLEFGCVFITIEGDLTEYFINPLFREFVVIEEHLQKLCPAVGRKV